VIGTFYNAPLSTQRSITSGGIEIVPFVQMSMVDSACNVWSQLPQQYDVSLLYKGND